MERRPFPWAGALALAAAVLLLYAPTARHEFVRYDDDVYLTDNPAVAAGLSADGVAWAFAGEHASNYHPLTWLSHMLDVTLFGLAPGPHHLVNAALHALNALLVLRVLWALLGAPWAAGLGAALFALHPLRVESVAWAAERKDLLCGLFWLLTVLAYLRHGRAPSPGRYALVCAGLVLALLSKPTAVVLPLALLALDAWPLGRLAPGAPPASRRRALREAVPLLVLAAAGAGLTLWAQSRGGSTSTLGDLGVDLRALNALASVAAYLGQTVLPVGLSVFHPHAALAAEEPRAALLVPALAGAALLAAGAVLGWRLRRSAPAVPLGLWWFLAPLLPVLGLVQVGTQAHADRYTYLPAVGLSLALAGLALRAPARAGRALVAAGLVAALALCGVTHVQRGRWRDTRTLFEHALALDERNWVAAAKLGELALDEGDAGRALELYERAVAIHPGYAEGLLGLALAHRLSGDPDRAAAVLERARGLYPDDLELRLTLGVVELERGNLASARAHLEACRAAAPTDPRVVYDLGLLARAEGDPEEALRLFREALTLDEGQVEAWSHVGQLQLARGDAGAAVAAFQRAVALAQDDGYAWFNLAVARRAQGDADGERQAFARALALAPELAEAHAALQEGPR